MQFNTKSNEERLLEFIEIRLTEYNSRSIH